NRLGLAPEEAIGIEDAIRMYTTHAAYAAFEENTRGTIEPGKLADLVAISGDPLTISPQSIRDLRVEMTMVGGKVVFER
ncbi:amidohydrolase family protein, partial [Candidatus Poribacteria bacterium]|nr:amidohydrolase family protein [Candidatus Poribacteria bacterium]